MPLILIHIYFTIFLCYNNSIDLFCRIAKKQITFLLIFTDNKPRFSAPVCTLLPQPASKTAAL